MASTAYFPGRGRGAREEHGGGEWKGRGRQGAGASLGTPGLPPTIHSHAALTHQPPWPEPHHWHAPANTPASVSTSTPAAVPPVPPAGPPVLPPCSACSTWRAGAEVWMAPPKRRISSARCSTNCGRVRRASEPHQMQSVRRTRGSAGRAAAWDLPRKALHTPPGSGCAGAQLASTRADSKPVWAGIRPAGTCPRPAPPRPWHAQGTAPLRGRAHLTGGAIEQPRLRVAVEHRGQDAGLRGASFHSSVRGKQRPCVAALQGRGRAGWRGSCQHPPSARSSARHAQRAARGRGPARGAARGAHGMHSAPSPAGTPPPGRRRPAPPGGRSTPAGPGRPRPPSAAPACRRCGAGRGCGAGGVRPARARAAACPALRPAGVRGRAGGRLGAAHTRREQSQPAGLRRGCRRARMHSSIHSFTQSLAHLVSRAFLIQPFSHSFVMRTKLTRSGRSGRRAPRPAARPRAPPGAAPAAARCRRTGRP